MLVSHDHSFIYFKTRKTASTSVELFFEPYCVSSPGHIPRHSTPQIVTKSGIVGSRRDGTKPGDTFYNHMPAEDILRLIGSDAFRTYTKFCNVRNPFDKMVSRFWWILSERGRIKEFPELSFNKIRHHFRVYILQNPPSRLANDRSAFCIGNRPVAQHYLRFENLSEDVEMLCSIIGIPKVATGLQNINMSEKPFKNPTSDYYDLETFKRVSEIFAWDIAKFGYKLRE